MRKVFLYTIFILVFPKVSNSQQNLPYMVGAYYFGGWHQNFYGGLNLSTAYEPSQMEMPSFGSSADFWSGPRHIYNNSAWFYERIPSVSESAYRKRYKPLMGYYDLLDKRVMETHIRIADKTIIRYELIRQYNTAKIIIYDLVGREVKIIKISSNQGKGEVNISSKDMAAGRYYYSLLVDNEMVDTKQLIITSN